MRRFFFLTCLLLPTLLHAQPDCPQARTLYEQATAPGVTPAE